MIELIQHRIKLRYGTEKSFCISENHGDPSNFTKLKNTVINKIDWLNRFLNPLGLKVEIIDKK